MAYLLLGSNLGNRMNNLNEAIRLLEDKNIVVHKASYVYQTAAWGLENQPDFLNQVIEVQTHLSPYPLLETTQEIEKKLGRIRDVKYGARTLDIDILYFNNDIIANEILSVPHPQLQNRRFTLVPLAQISPDYIHPVLGLTNLALLEKCEDSGLVSRFYDNET